MRRSIVFTLLAAAAAVALLAPAGSAGASSRSAHIICPQYRAYVVPPCCPLPPQPAGARAQPICCQATPCCQTTCCQPTTCPVATPTITSSPNPSRAGHQVVITGTAGSGATVALWRKLANQSTFNQVSTTSAGGSGKYTFTLKSVMANQQWYVTSNGQQSQTVSQQVRALVSVAAFAVGHTIALRGHVTPSHAGEVVLIEVSRGGTWQVIARPHLGRGSRYSASHHFAKSGTVRFRVVLKADGRNQQSTSPTLKVTVKS